MKYEITWSASCKGVFTLEMKDNVKTDPADVAIELIETVLGGAMDTENIDIDCIVAEAKDAD